MDRWLQLQGINFVWDEQKARANLKKHGVSFEQAAEAFFDPFLRLVDASTEGEGRDAIIGTDSLWILLYVVHVAFEEDHIRIISARRATAPERKSYED